MESYFGRVYDSQKKKNPNHPSMPKKTNLHKFSLSDLAVDNRTSYNEGHEHLLSQVLTGPAACLAPWSQ